MPTYQYVCTNPDGKHEFELVQSFTDDPVDSARRAPHRCARSTARSAWSSRAPASTGRTAAQSPTVRTTLVQRLVVDRVVHAEGSSSSSSSPSTSESSSSTSSSSLVLLVVVGSKAAG